MEYLVVIEGKFPSLNEFISANRTNAYKGNVMKQASQSKIMYELYKQHRGLKIEKPIRIAYTYYEANRKRDLDNVSGFFHKVFQDALVACEIIPNDNWQYIKGYSDEFFLDVNNPRVEIRIEVAE